MPFPDDPTKPRPLGSPPTAVAATPAGVRAPVIARPTSPALGTVAGEAVRTGARTALAASAATGTAVANASTALPRALGGVARDFGNAVLGNPASPNAGQPLSGFSIPRPSAPAATASTPASSGKTSTPASVAGAMPNFSGLKNIANLARPTTPAAPLATPIPAQNAVAPAATGGGLPAVDRVLGTFTGRNGTRTITETGANALAAKLPIASGPVVTALGGNFAYAPSPQATAATMAAPQGGTGVPVIPRPGAEQPAVGFDGTRLKFAGMDRDAHIRNLDEQIAKIGTPDRRSKRDLLATLLQQRGAAVGQSGSIAADLAGAQLGSSTNLAQTAMGQNGENYRADAAQTGENYRMLNRPDYQADGQGVVNQIVNGISRPVADAAGKPLRVVTTDKKQSQEQSKLRDNNLASIAKTAMDFMPQTQDPTPEQIIKARAYAASVNGIKTTKDEQGNVFAIINGEAVPL